MKASIEDFAKELFVYTLSSHMAKTLSAFKELAKQKFRVPLEIRIIPESEEYFIDEKNQGELTNGIKAVIETSAQYKDSDCAEFSHIKATIVIQKETCAPLVKFIILHELRHLYIELSQYVASRKTNPETVWEPRRCSDTKLYEEEEDECDKFAYILSYYHEQIYNSEALKRKYKSFYFALTDHTTPHNIRQHIKKFLDTYESEGENFIVPVSFEQLVNEGLKEYVDK